MAKFLSLFKKDLEASKWPLGIFSGLIILLMLFFRYKVTQGWAPESVIASIAIPLMFLPLWLVWQSFQTLRSEWKEDTVYTLLVLPVPGWHITLAKILALVVEYTVLLVVIVGGSRLILGTVLAQMTPTAPLSWIIRNGFLAYLVSVGVLIGVAIFAQLAFVVSKMVGRFQGFVALWVLVLASWFVRQLGMILEPFVSWIPPISLVKLLRLEEVGLEIQRLDFYLAPKVGIWLGAFLLFALTAWLMEHYVEIND